MSNELKNAITTEQEKTSSKTSGWKTKFRKIGIAALWLIMISGLIVSLSFVSKEEKKVKCTEIIVNIDPEHELQFIDRETILRTIRADGNEKKIIGQSIVSLNIPLLEQELEANKLIRNAEVYTDMNGVLHIHINQREPVLRVINTNGHSFYIDKKGGKMPVSTMFTARVPIATGNIYESYKDNDSIESFIGKELFKIATYVDKDAFWKAQIEQIFVTGENELVLVPKIGDHTIAFGTTENMEDKFDKLMLFYREALNRIGWDKYSSIDLRYKDQIVCKKN